jgi:hypothetical protein
MTTMLIHSKRHALIVQKPHVYTSDSKLLATRREGHWGKLLAQRILT